MEIFNRLDEIPHLQEIIIGHYKSALNKDHEEHDKQKFILNSIAPFGTYKCLTVEPRMVIEYEGQSPNITIDIPGIREYCEHLDDFYGSNKKKEYYKILRHLFTSEMLKSTLTLNIEVLTELKNEIGYYRRESRKKYPSSKRKRDRYFRKHYKPSGIA